MPPAGLVRLLHLVASSRGGGAAHVRDLALGLDPARHPTPPAKRRREATHIHIARTPEEFLAAVREVLAHPPTMEERARWRTVAETHSWERQVGEIERHLALLLAAARDTL